MRTSNGGGPTCFPFKQKNCSQESREHFNTGHTPICNTADITYQYRCVIGICNTKLRKKEGDQHNTWVITYGQMCNRPPYVIQVRKKEGDQHNTWVITYGQMCNRPPYVIRASGYVTPYVILAHYVIEGSITYYNGLLHTAAPITYRPLHI